MEGKLSFIEELQRAIGEGLPGPEVQYRMAPAIRLENKFGKYRNAAVLILLYRKQEEWFLVLMKRIEYAGVHSNQVSLPGGLHESPDTDLGQTALRETREETGINDENVRLLGQLSKLEIPVSGIVVSPYIGYYKGIPEFNHEPGEVSYLIEVPLSELSDPGNIKEDIRTIHFRVVKVPYYHLQGEKVWGATAMMLSEFNEILRRTGQ